MKTPFRKKADFWVVWLFRIALLVYLCIDGYKWLIQGDSAEWYNVSTVFVTFALTYIPVIVEKCCKVQFSSLSKITFWIYVFMGNFLGQFLNVYDSISWRDILVHGISGIIFGYIGFILLYFMNTKETPRMSRFFLVSFAFFFSATCAAFWEFFEFGSNCIGVVMGGDLMDTITDIMVGSLGGLFAAGLGYISLSEKKNLTFLSWFSLCFALLFGGYWAFAAGESGIIGWIFAGVAAGGVFFLCGYFSPYGEKNEYFKNIFWKTDKKPLEVETF